MCGIGGYFNNKSNGDEIISIIDKINNLQIHRGPDSSNKFLNNRKNLGLVMCRLSILDLELGSQPMNSQDGRYTIIFNGTIINAPELRVELEKKGEIFFSNNSDTEVLLKIMINYGKQGLKKLNGAFAFAFYDNLKNKLICVRDRFGQSPFYFYWKNNIFLFASELKSILYTKYCSLDINLESLNHYLSLLWVPGPNTIIKDIKKLPAGNLIELDLNNSELKIEEWWDISIKEDESLNDLNTLIPELKNKLEDSVKRATLSDVPVACGLSGGLDSQAIVSLLTKNNILPSTFTLGFESYSSGALNELDLSKTASIFFKTDHTEIKINKEDYFQDLNKMIYHLDEPYGGGLPSWHIMKQAGKQFGVILTGLGGDELFGNYGRWTLLEKTRFDIFKSYFHFEKLFFDRKYFFSDILKKKLLIEKTENSTGRYLFNILNKNPNLNIRNRIMYMDFKTQLQDEYCNLINKFSMGNHIEARAPFLDYEFTDLVFRIPSKIRTKKNDTKYLLREMMKNLIPEKNLNNRKRGFVGLESQNIKYNFQNIKNNLFNKKKIISQNIFQYEILFEFITSFENNKMYQEQTGFLTKKYSFKSLWALIMFQMWYDILIEKKDNFELKFEA